MTWRELSTGPEEAEMEALRMQEEERMYSAYSPTSGMMALSMPQVQAYVEDLDDYLEALYEEEMGKKAVSDG